MNKNTLLYVAALTLLSGVLHAQQGLVGEYYAGTNFERKVMSRIDHDIDFDWPADFVPAPGILPSQYSVRWTGRLKAPETGHYYFSAKVDDGLRVWVGNKLVIDAWGLHDSESFAGAIDLQAGQVYDLRVEFFNAILEGEIHLSWELPSEAPTFGGWLGRNDHKIDPKYMLQPVDAAKLTAGDKPEVSAPAKPVRKKTAPKVEIAPSAKPQTALEDTIQKYTPRNIMFEQSKSIMLQGSLAEMDRLADMLKRYPNLHVSVEGHTDNIGDSVKNQKLSEERAAAVAAYLVHAGIASDRVSSKGFGGSRPLTQEKTAEGHARNRRVEFVIK